MNKSNEKYEAYLKELETFIQRVPLVSQEEPHIEVLWERANRYGFLEERKKITKEEFKKKHVERHQFQCAQVLKAIEDSWAQYETPVTILELVTLHVSQSMDNEQAVKKAENCFRWLKNHNLVESQGERYRRKQ